MPEPSLSRQTGTRSHVHSASPGLSIESVRDRVIRAALSSGLASSNQLAEAWAEFSLAPRPQRGRFWRFLADRSGADREAFYALAAKTYGFEEVDLSVSDLIRFLRQVRGSFNSRQWRTMVALRILPIGHDSAGDEGQNLQRLVFASSDPTRIEVNNFLSSLPVKSFVLRYAVAHAVDYVLDRVLPVIFSTTDDSETIFDAGVRLVPLDPVRERVMERGSLRKAA